METIDAIVSEFDVRSSRFTYVSAALERLLGYPVQKFLGSPRFWFSCIHPDDRERVKVLALASTAGRPREPYDYRVHDADGRVVWLRDHSRVFLGDDGEPSCVRGVSVDVTALKVAEAAGEEARSLLEATLAAERTYERRYRETLENISLIAASIDAVGTVRFANDFLLELTGWSRQEVVGHDWFERFDDDPDVRADYFECMARGEIRKHFESTLRTRSGEIRIVSWSSILEHDETGAVGGIVTIGEDVTERRHAEDELRRHEEHFRSLIENASDVISVLSVDGTSLYESPSVERVLGWTPAELVGSRNFALRHPDDADTVAVGIERVLGGEQAEPIEFRLRHKDGSWRTVEAVVQMRTQDERPVLVTNYRDITERRELEQQLLHSQRLEAVGRLAGGIAHDFNNLLTVIGGYAEVLIAGFDNEDSRLDDAREIASAADRAAALTRQLLAFSSRQVMKLEVLELAPVVADLETLLGRLLGEDVEITTSVEAGCYVEADRGQLEQVLTNLAVNARDAMPAGGCLSISTRHVGHAGRPFVEIAVSDTGTGMDAETLSHLFEPFFTTKDASKGSGLGLATVYGIVAQSGGEVLVDSVLGEGS
ncbi:MAG: PAS domain S-box protein, partial [Actinobacteria bacterium]|nr:PAS domain S-box protein [Actinomycetota bacterium]